MAELVEFLVKELVDNPDKVVVTEDGDVVKVTVAQSDMGRIIGKQGRVAKSIRTIAKSAAAKLGKKCVVEIVEA